MRTTVTIDDELLKDALEFSGIKEKSVVINEALRWFVAREAGKRLAKLGGSAPDIEAPPRRRLGGNDPA
jgi:Arc/MetJ family transcription regulator